MKLLLFFDITIIFLISFFIVRKRLHVFINIFTFMVLEFLIASYFAVLYVNLKAWEVANSTDLFYIFRIYEVILMPLLYISYFNLIDALKNRYIKFGLSIVLIGVLYGIELLLVHWKVIVYKEWHFWQSIVSLFLILLISNILQVIFGHILRKEGIQD